MAKTAKKKTGAGKAGKAARRAKVAKKVNPIPAGHRTVTPHLILDDCAGAIEFYKKAFGAREKIRMNGPDGKIAHAEVQVGDSMIMMNDQMDTMPGQPGVYKSPRVAGFATAALFLYVPKVDAVFDRAVKAGCTVKQPPMDMFWGDRWAQVIDPFGHTWGMATHTEDLTPAQMRKRQADFMAQMAQGGAPA